MKYPLFKIVFFLIIGIYIEINYHLFQVETYLLFLFTCLSLLFLELVLKNTSYTKKFFSEFLITLSIVFSGILLVDFKSDSQTKNYIGNTKLIKEKKRKFKTNLEIYHPIFISQNSVKINKAKNESLINFFDTLEEDDDVQNIYSNVEFIE